MFDPNFAETLQEMLAEDYHGTRYTDGVYREGATIMHVTRGLSVRMPLRWLCPPEIALLELVK